MTILNLIKSLGRGGAELLLPGTLWVHDRQRYRFVYGYFLENKNQVVPEFEALDAEVHCFKANKPLHILSKVRAVAQYASAVHANVIRPLAPG